MGGGEEGSKLKVWLPERTDERKKGWKAGWLAADWPDEWMNG